MDLLTFARSYTAAWCCRDAARVAAHYAPEGSLCINGGAPAVGRPAIVAAAQSFMTTFPDLVVTLDRLVEGAAPEYHWTLSGTSGTGAKIRISGVEVWTMSEDGMIAESQGQFDRDVYDRQLGGG